MHGIPLPASLHTSAVDDAAHERPEALIVSASSSSFTRAWTTTRLEFLARCTSACSQQWPTSSRQGDSTLLLLRWPCQASLTVVTLPPSASWPCSHTSPIFLPVYLNVPPILNGDRSLSHSLITLLCRGATSPGKSRLRCHKLSTRVPSTAESS